MTQHYDIRLTKTIVVTVEADSEQEAVDSAVNNDEGYDGEWERAEHKTKCLGHNQKEFDLATQYLEEDRAVMRMAEYFRQDDE